LKQLETLYWVAKLGSFQAAATRLHTTQSAVSKRIAELETIGGQALFDRSRRAARLTLHGRRVAAEAQRMIALCDGLFDSSSPRPAPQEVFLLGASELIGMTWLPHFIESAQRQYPEILFDVHVNHGGHLVEGLNEGRFDLVLLPGPMWSDAYAGAPLHTLARVWLAHPSLGIPRRVFTLQELSEYPILSQYRDTVHSRLQSSWFYRHGVRLRPRLRAHSFPALGEMVRAGIGIAHLPELYYAEDMRDGRLCKLRVSPAVPDIKYFAVYPREHTHPFAAELALMAQEVCDFSQHAGSVLRLPLSLPFPDDRP